MNLWEFLLIQTAIISLTIIIVLLIVVKFWKYRNKLKRRIEELEAHNE